MKSRQGAENDDSIIQMGEESSFSVFEEICMLGSIYHVWERAEPGKYLIKENA